MRTEKKGIDFRDLFPGTIILNVQLDMTEAAVESWRDEEFGHATMASLRTVAAMMVRVGDLPIEKIEGGRAHIKCDETVLEKLVDGVVERRIARREAAALAAQQVPSS